MFRLAKVAWALRSRHVLSIVEWMTGYLLGHPERNGVEPKDRFEGR